MSAPNSSPQGWIHGPRADTVIALLWVPFAIAAALALSDGDHLSRVVGFTLFVSLAHQPLTVGLVYGDPAQFSVARQVFSLAPFLFVAAVFIGFHVSLALVGVVAGLWNAEHTLMQRYGVVRIYGRKAGEGARRDERPMLFSWLLLALVWAAADPRTPSLLRKVDLGANNERGIEVLIRWQWAARLLVVPIVIGAVVLAVRWFGEERRRSVRIGPKHLYLASTAMLFAVMMLSPIVGVVGYVGAHAVEYLVIVRGALLRRYRGDDAEDGGVVGRLARTPLRPTGLMAAYLAFFLLGFLAVDRWGSAFAYSMVFLTVGGMHVLYDGLIWRQRQPVVARSLASAPMVVMRR